MKHALWQVHASGGVTAILQDYRIHGKSIILIKGLGGTVSNERTSDQFSQMFDHRSPAMDNYTIERDRPCTRMKYALSNHPWKRPQNRILGVGIADAL